MEIGATSPISADHDSILHSPEPSAVNHLTIRKKERAKPLKNSDIKNSEPWYYFFINKEATWLCQSHLTDRRLCLTYQKT